MTKDFGAGGFSWDPPPNRHHHPKKRALGAFTDTHAEDHRIHQILARQKVDDIVDMLSLMSADAANAALDAVSQMLSEGLVSRDQAVMPEDRVLSRGIAYDLS